MGAAVRLTVFVIWTLIMVGPYSAMMILRGGYRKFGQVYWRGVSRICRMQIKVTGELATERPLLVVSNHNSYLDIIVLNTLIPGVFVAKSEVAGWPGFGILARLARTVFVDRKRSSVARNAEEIKSRMAEGDPLILFPEGTSNDGNRVLPFKTALFAVASMPVSIKGAPEALPVVQPVSVAFTKVDGIPMGRLWRPLYAWYGDMDLAGHLWEMLRFGVVTVEVRFHPVRDPATFASRKALADQCYQDVSTGVASSLTGREIAPTPLLPPPGAEAPALTAPPSPTPILQGEGAGS
ncbi:MAG: lysophospholipid acyltransferase family protein [Rhodospirillaceae bacterium]